MVAIKNALQLAVLSLPFTVEASRWTFRINVKRWDNLACIGYKTLENPKALGTKIKDGDCQSWPKAKSFNALAIQWMSYTVGQDLQTDERCAVLVYEKDKCGGHLIWYKDDVNTMEALGDCYSLDGVPGRSMKLTCRKTGTEPDWMSETHWTTPMVYNETVVETVVLPILE
ncbi:hypothetical protein TI39_contig5926g00006 [Zymoseptoria brevis]|uniref:Ecp2 effector protein domain-containing protein n=1 Tax=Zymoseptoria brevis TaxID=1047168 RepID=A0A0F4G420_9PEZI|nr:hypothetical protein TI39_contig5926g00006 [Zymoseptoria brevis]